LWLVILFRDYCGHGSGNDYLQRPLLLQVANEHLAIGMQNVDPLSISATGEIHMPDDISWQKNLLNLDNPLIDVGHDDSKKMRIGACDLAQVGKVRVINIVTSRIRMPRP